MRVADEGFDDFLDGWGAVDDLVGCNSSNGGPENDARGISARFSRGEADVFKSSPDLWNVLDLDPMQLDVLPVRDIGDVSSELTARSGQWCVVAPG